MLLDGTLYALAPPRARGRVVVLLFLVLLDGMDEWLIYLHQKGNSLMEEQPIHVQVPDAFEESKEAAELKETYWEILERQQQEMAATTDETERRAIEGQQHKELIRLAFMTHPQATEDDFERLWPRLRDDDFCEHAHLIYMQTMEALQRDLDAESEEEQSD
jgi:hypothetical protein